MILCDEPTEKIASCCQMNCDVEVEQLMFCWPMQDGKTLFT